MSAVLSIFVARPWRKPEPVQDAASALDSLRRWIAATTEAPLCECHEPPQPMRWHKDSRRAAGGYYECPQRVAEMRRRRVSRS